MQAPELLETRQATRATDVYAFGIILAELLTLRTPFHNMSEYRVGAAGWLCAAFWQGSHEWDSCGHSGCGAAHCMWERSNLPPMRFVHPLLWQVAGHVLDGGRPKVPALDELPGPDTAQVHGVLVDGTARSRLHTSQQSVPLLHCIGCYLWLSRHHAMFAPPLLQFAGLEAYIDLMRECWAQQPEERPSFEQIVPRLK